jgi:hypothetical protein
MSLAAQALMASWVSMIWLGSAHMPDDSCGFAGFWVVCGDQGFVGPGCGAKSRLALSLPLLTHAPTRSRK